MKKFIWLAVAFLVITATACSSDIPTSTPTPAPRATWTSTVTQVTRTPTKSATPVIVASSPTPAPTMAPTIVPTLVPTATPTSVAGLYVTDLRIDPNPPLRGADLHFYPAFANRTGVVQNFRWLVYVFRPDNLRTSSGETTAGLFQIPTGNSELKSAGPWRIALGGPCEDFVARVAWFDPNNKAINFTKPDGQVFEKIFRVCAPSDLPPPTPGPSPTPTATPTFAPGVFVADVRVEPHPPTRGSDLIFWVTFVNTIGSPQNTRWNAYIYKPGEPNSYGETTISATNLGIGINEYRANGFWKLPLGGPCENFVMRVGWFDSENKLKLFTRFENLVFEEPFTVCPP